MRIPNKAPDALFDIAESMQPRATDKESSTAAAIHGLTLQDWVLARSLPLAEECRLISPHIIGICFSVADHKALDRVKDKV